MNINRYNLEYWLWAILTKKFGKTLNLKRSCVSKIYDVNKHDFEILGTDPHILREAYAYLCAYLESCGYVETSAHIGSDNNYMKTFGTSMCYVRLNYTPDFYGKPLFSCTSSVYNAIL